MSIRRLCSVHKIEVLSPAIRAGQAWGAQRDYNLAAYGRILLCRVMPRDPTELVQHDEEGYLISHAVWFYFDPQIGKLNRLRFPIGPGGTIMRPLPATAPSEQGRAWIVLATTRSEDNPALVEPH